MFRSIRKKILSINDLPTIRERAKRTGSKIVFTEGFWDLYHDEHAAFIKNAARHGDWLVVGVVQDDQMFPLKGRHPHYDEQRRLYTVAAHCCIDWALLLRDPADVILTLKPDIVVISLGSLKDRNQEKRRCAAELGAKLVEIGSKNTIHSSEVARRLAQGE